MIRSFYICLILILFNTGCSQEDDLNENLEKDLVFYTEELKSDPENCVAISQLATIYQIKKEFQLASEFFQKEYEVCGEIAGLFHHGLSLCFLGKTSEGKSIMDQAIKEADEVKNYELRDLLKSEFSMVQELLEKGQLPINWKIE